MEMIQIATMTESRISQLLGSNISTLGGVEKLHVDLSPRAGDHLTSASYICADREKNIERVRQCTLAADDCASTGDFKEAALPQSLRTEQLNPAGSRFQISLP